MRYFLFLAFTLLVGFGVSCTQAPTLTPSEQLQERVELLEARNGANPSPENKAKLFEAYEAQSQDTALSVTKRLDRIRYIAEALYVGGKHDEAYHRLRRGIADLPEATTVLDASLFLAEIVIQRRQEPQTAELLFATLRDRFESDPGLAKIPEAYTFVSLPDMQKKLQMEVYPPNGFNKDAAIRYGKASWVYTAIERDPTLVIKDHLAAGRVLEQAKNYMLAEQHYDEVIRRFPNSPRAGDALMLKAVIKQDVYRQLDEAKKLLTRLLADYPNHELADDAKSLLETLN